MAHDGKIRFGIFSPLSGLTFDSLMARAGLAERLGYHSIWLDDHMWTRGDPRDSTIWIACRRWRRWPRAPSDCGWARW